MPIRADYKGITLVHEQGALPIIQDLMKEFNPKLMMEFGTSWGGFTLLMHHINTSVELHTYDIPGTIRRPNRNQFGENVHFHMQDILTEEVDVIIDLCQDERKKILYCDNGHKIDEILMYGCHLNSGDMLGVHDWTTELVYDDVKEVLDDFNPHPINQKFKKEGWMSRFFLKK
jgi:cephalosporin hydroxylase